MTKTITFVVFLLLLTNLSGLNNGFARGTEGKSEQSPETVVQQFYDFHFSHDMAFTEDAVQQRAAWFTPDLREAIRAYFAIPQNPDEPPYINGDPFTSTQEYPVDFSVVATKREGTSARVDVKFHWEETDPRAAVAVVKQINGKWLIDDLEFQDQESLRKMLKMEVR